MTQLGIDVPVPRLYRLYSSIMSSTLKKHIKSNVMGLFPHGVPRSKIWKLSVLIVAYFKNTYDTSIRDPKQSRQLVSIYFMLCGRLQQSLGQVKSSVFSLTRELTELGFFEVVKFCLF